MLSIQGYAVGKRDLDTSENVTIKLPNFFSLSPERERISAYGTIMCSTTSAATKVASSVWAFSPCVLLRTFDASVLQMSCNCST